MKVTTTKYTTDANQSERDRFAAVHEGDCYKIYNCRRSKREKDDESLFYFFPACARKKKEERIIVFFLSLIYGGGGATLRDTIQPTVYTSKQY